MRLPHSEIKREVLTLSSTSDLVFVGLTHVKYGILAKEKMRYMKNICHLRGHWIIYQPSYSMVRIPVMEIKVSDKATRRRFMRFASSALFGRQA